MVNLLSYVAYRHKLTFNSGNYMRKEPGVKELCARTLEPDEVIDPDTIYVVERQLRRALEQRGAVCGLVDGLNVCVDRDKPSPMSGAFQGRR